MKVLLEFGIIALCFCCKQQWDTIQNIVINEARESLEENPEEPQELSKQSTTDFTFYAYDTASDKISILNSTDEPDTINSLSLNGNRMYYAIGEMLSEIDSMSAQVENERWVRKAWRYIHQKKYHYFPFTGAVWQHNPKMFFNSLGFGFCDDFASVFYHLAYKKGYNSRVWGLGGHVVSEVYDSEKWELFDCDYGAYYYNDSGQIAGVQELEQNPSLISDPINPILPLGSGCYELRYLYESIYNNSIAEMYHAYIDIDSEFLAIPPNSRIDFPCELPEQVISVDGQAVPQIKCLKVTMQNGIDFEFPFPLILSKIEGKGVASADGIDYPLGKEFDDALENRSSRFSKLRVSADSNVVLFFLLNPIRFHLENGTNELHIEKRGESEMVLPNYQQANL
jgi:hypothetical protein